MHGDTCMFMVEKIQPTVSDKIKEYSHTFPKEQLTSKEIVHKKSTLSRKSFHLLSYYMLYFFLASDFREIFFTFLQGLLKSIFLF